MRKVFGIGLCRTGTTSLAQALRFLGYDCVHWPLSMKSIIEHEASCDITVSCRYKELDKLFPGSQFILTVRSEDDWVTSCMAFFGHVLRASADEPLLLGGEFATEAKKRLFGDGALDDPKICREAYRKHRKDVEEYFGERKEDLLVYDVREGWGSLCSFLKKSIPDFVFPKLNARGNRTGDFNLLSFILTRTDDANCQKQNACNLAFQAGAV